MYKKKSLIQHIALKKKDFLLINLWFVIASIITLVFKLSFTIYIVLFALPPIIYIFRKLTLSRIIVITIFSAISTFSFVISLDIIAHQTGAWVINGTFGVKLFNVTTWIDNFIWGVLYAILILAMYEYFFDRNNKFFRSIRLKKLMLFIIILGLITYFSFYFVNYQFIQYSYLIITIGLVSLTLFFSHINNPTLVKKILLFGIYGLIPSIIYDYTAITNDHWQFLPMRHIFYININGYKYPFEELLWLFFFITTILFFYEYFADDNH